MSERFTTPVGRFIQGDCFAPQTKDQSGQPRVVKSGPNAGQPNPQFFVGLAIPKSPGVIDWRQEPDPFFQSVLRVGQQDFPGGQTQRPDFAWKIVDGDSPTMNKSGRIINTIEGYAGHWVCRFQSSYPPKCFSRQIGYAASDQISDPAAIRRGHYITVNGSVTGNGNMTNNPGVYLNLDLISWEGYGPEITSGPDAAAAFATAPALPVGVSGAPVVPAPTAAPVAVPVPAPTASPAPYAGFMAPPAVPAPPPVSAVPAPMMLPAAGGATYEQMVAAGWTDALLLQHGMMVA
jgi:hypothetical protein